MSIEHYRARKRREAESADVEATKALVGTLSASIADGEGDVATDNRAAGVLLVTNGRLCRTTRAIVRGERLVEGINVTPVSVAEVIEAIESKE